MGEDEGLSIPKVDRLVEHGEEVAISSFESAIMRSLEGRIRKVSEERREEWRILP